MSAVVMKVLWMYGLAAVVAAAIAVLIKVVVVLLGVLERRGAPAAATPVTAAAPVPAPVEEGVPGPHLAAIAAAVHAVLGAHRIVRIEEARAGSGWTAEGRAAHHASHARTPRVSPR